MWVSVIEVYVQGQGVSVTRLVLRLMHITRSPIGTAQPHFLVLAEVTTISPCLLCRRLLPVCAKPQEGFLPFG